MKRLLRHPDLPPLAFLLFVACLVMAPGLLTGRALLPADALFNFYPWKPLAGAFGVTVPQNDLAADMILQNYSWKELVKAGWLSGQFPLWNPSILTGLPLLAAGQASPLYPVSVPLFLLLPTVLAYGWNMALHLFIAAAGAYWLVRTLGAGRFGGLVSGLAFGLCGFLVVSFMWPQMVGSAVWMPALLACMERLVRVFELPAGRLGRAASAAAWTAAGGVVVALQFLGGHMEMSFYALFLLLAYFLFRLGTVAWRRWWLAALYLCCCAGLMVGVGMLLAGVQIVPFYELIKQNFRSGDITLADAVSFALPKLQLLAFVLPDVFGNPTHHSYFDLFRLSTLPVEGSTDLAGAARSYPFWGVKNYVEGTAYVGLLPLVAAAAALLVRRDRYVAFFAGYGAFSLLLAFGTPLYALFFFGIPGMEQLHTPFRWVLPWSLCTAVLAGLGADALRRQTTPLATRLAAWAGPLVAGTGALVLLAAAAVFAAKGALLPRVAAWRERSEALAAAFPTPEMLLSYEWRNLAVFGAVLLATGVALAVSLRTRRRWLVLAAPVVLAADLVGFAWGFLAFTNPAIPMAQTDLVRWLGEQGGGQPFRVVSYPQSDVLPPDTAMLAKVQDVRGYDTVILRQYVEYWKLMEEPSGLPYSQINRLARAESLDSPYLNLLNVRYVLSRDEFERPGYRRVYQRDGVNVYENLDVLPRAFVATQAQPADGLSGALAALRTPGFDPRRAVVVDGPAADGAPGFAAATVTAYSANAVTVGANLASAGYLVLTDAYFDGWQAEVDGAKPKDVIRVDGVFRGVLLEPGEHTVTFSYRPVSLRLGLYLSFMGLVVLLLLLAFVGWQRLHRGGAPAADGSNATRVMRNSVTPASAQLIARVVDFGFAIFTLRWLGPTDYGAYAFAVVLIGYFAIFTDYGLGTLTTREVARDPTQADRYFTNTVVARLVLCVVLTPVLLAVAGAYHLWFGVEAGAVVAAFLFMVSLVPSAVAGAISSLFAAHQRMEYQAVMTVATTVVRALLGLVALLAGTGVMGLASVSVAASTFTAVAFWVLIRRSGFAPRLALDVPFGRAMVRSATPLMLNNLLNSIFFRIDILVLQPIRGAEAVAYYSTAYKFIDALLTVSSFFTLAFFPVMSQYARDNRPMLLRTYAQALKGLLLLGLPIAVGTTYIAEPLIATFFGPEFSPAARALQLLVWFLPFSYINGLTQYVLIAVDQQHYLTKAFMVAAVFNLGGNLLLVPVLGMEGAALMTIASEWVLMAPFLAGVWRHVGPLPVVAITVRPALAAGGMAAVLWLLSPLPLPATVAAGSLAYVALVAVLGTLDAQDRAVLRRILRR